MKALALACALLTAGRAGITIRFERPPFRNCYRVRRVTDITVDGQRYVVLVSRDRHVLLVSSVVARFNLAPGDSICGDWR